LGKARRFKPAGETGVTVFVTGRTPVEVRGDIETDDPDVIEALQGSPNVVEVKDQAKGQSAKKKD
jgi:hypothetical protein